MFQCAESKRDCWEADLWRVCLSCLSRAGSLLYTKRSNELRGLICICYLKANSVSEKRVSNAVTFTGMLFLGETH